MALTCSVLGHAYGQPTVERDREERGSEVVVTIREYETCTRCGTTRIVSENKEVTAVEAGEDAPEPITDRTTDVDEPPAEPRGGSVEGASPDLGGNAADDGAVAAADADGAAADDADVTDEGAEILDAEADAPVEGEAVDEELASPSVAGETADAGDASDASGEDDAVVIEAAGEADDGRAPGEWPEEDEPEGDDEWSPPSEPLESSPTDPVTEPEPTVGPTITVPEGEFHCEECGYSTPVESSSLRAGDFCPECHRGALTHVRDSS